MKGYLLFRSTPDGNDLILNECITDKEYATNELKEYMTGYSPYSTIIKLEESCFGFKEILPNVFFYLRDVNVK